MAPSDLDLLRQYAHDGSQAAFAALVERHLNLVYSAARRQVRSPQLAEDVAQTVFVDLASHARSLPSATPLVAWLHLVTRRTAIDVVRRESRRQARETEAAEIARTDSVMKPSPSDWEAVEPLLDEAVESLPAPDRTAILLRFFENKSLREVGAALGASEDAAQKRVTRAVEQLRAFFLRRGVSITAAGLASNLSAHVIQIAPTALGAAISSSAVWPGAALGHAAVAATRSLVMTTLQKTFLVTAVAAVVGGGLYETSVLLRQHRESQELQQRTDRLLAELRQARGDRDLALRRQPAPQRPAAAPARPAAGDFTLEPEAQAWLARVNQLKTLAGQRTDLTIPETGLLDEQDWFSAARSAGFDNEAAIRDAFRRLRDLAKARIRPRLSNALHRYVDTHDGMLPADPIQLAPFFDPPIDAAILLRYEMLQTGKLSDAGSDWLLDERAPIDGQHDSRLFLSATGSGTSEFGAPRSGDVRAAVQGFATANNGQLPTEPIQLLPYFKNPLSPAAQANFLQTPREMFKPGELLKPTTRAQAR